MTDIILHLGYHKTGSTLLQKSIFPRVSRLVMPFSEPELLDLVRQHLTHPRDPEKFRSIIKERIPEDAETCVLSSEALLYNPYERRGFEKETLQGLAEAFPEAKVLVVFREQQSWLNTWYRHRVRAGYSLRATCLTKRSKVPGVAEALNLNCLRYDCAYELLCEVFNQSAVNFIPYELIRRDPSSFSKFLSGLLNKDVKVRDSSEFPVVNKGYGAASVVAGRFINGFLHETHPEQRAESVRENIRRKALYWMDKFCPAYLDKLANKKLNNDLRLPCEYYAESNRELSGLLGLKLKDLGYDV